MKIKKTHYLGEKMYEYAKASYEHYGNLDVPGRFKTNDGYTNDDNGKIKLGRWVAYQRIKENTEPEREKKC